MSKRLNGRLRRISRRELLKSLAVASLVPWVVACSSSSDDEKVFEEPLISDDGTLFFEGVVAGDRAEHESDAHRAERDHHRADDGGSCAGDRELGDVAPVGVGAEQVAGGAGGRGGAGGAAGAAGAAA